MIPLIALAPVDGVTDAAFRQIVDEVGKPDMLFTEFVPAEGLLRGRTPLLHALLKHKTTTPIVAQFFGGEPTHFYTAFFVAAELGFSGIDVNMGCPDSSIVKRGGGAALLLNIGRAVEIINALKQARVDWQNGKRLKDTDLPEIMQSAVKSVKSVGAGLTGSTNLTNSTQLTISVKTRIGYHGSQVSEVIPRLAEAGVDFISLHGRTFDQRYSGSANWDEIARAGELMRGSGVRLFGNGDLHSRAHAIEMCKKYQVDGALIARVAFGNPWIFKNYTPTWEERKSAMLYHCELFLKYRPDLDLRPMRKHITWYCKGQEGSAKLRDKLMKVVTIDDLKAILNQRLPHSA